MSLLHAAVRYSRRTCKLAFDVEVSMVGVCGGHWNNNTILESILSIIPTGEPAPPSSPFRLSVSNHQRISTEQTPQILQQLER